MLKSY